ncbi:hypothetical protein [Devosia sp.]|uniref:hypothetical protein n=1 Tax=Devosia sp. TaxID=1871048 RepID=UPI00273640A7|nr:hypothetical protein [Devosia sp.]MDP2779772.1 hypothetical protein [Devosia sp.]
MPCNAVAVTTAKVAPEVTERVLGSSAALDSLVKLIVAKTGEPTTCIQNHFYRGHTERTAGFWIETSGYQVSLRGGHLQVQAKRPRTLADAEALKAELTAYLPKLANRLLQVQIQGVLSLKYRVTQSQYQGEALVLRLEV